MNTKCVFLFPLQLLSENSQSNFFYVSLTVHLSAGAPDGHLLTVTIPDAVLIQFDLPRISKTLLETCRGLQYMY